MTGLSLKELLDQLRHSLSQMWAGWTVKFPLAALAGFHTDCLEADCTAVIFSIWFFMVLLDLFFGACLAVKRRRFSVKVLNLWVIKMGAHCFTILIVGLTFRSFLMPVGLDIPIFDMFLSLLVCTEALSVLKNMKQLGLPVPQEATRLISLAHDEAERKTAECFGQPEIDRRKRPEEVIEDDSRQQDSNLLDRPDQPGLNCPGLKHQQPGCSARPGLGRKKCRNSRAGRKPQPKQ